MHAHTSPLETKADAIAPEKSQLEQLLTYKGPKPAAFVPGNIKLTDQIADHVAWAFQHIYSVSYPGSFGIYEIARHCHGIQHVARAAMYIPVFANLYRRYGDQEALGLTVEDIKLLQIATVFHDAAREGEEEDLWDQESALMLYYYLTKVLNVPEETAQKLAEAVANKDVLPSGKQPYYQLRKCIFQQMTWTEVKIIPKKNIYQKLIHDADCLDIIRARDHFEATYLDFYQEIAAKNPDALDEMAQVIIEARSIIEFQGDGRKRNKTKIKKYYEQADAYQKILQSMEQAHLSLLPFFYANGRLLSSAGLRVSLLETQAFEAKQELDEANLRAALREGKVFARSIAVPSALRNKKKHAPETLAAVEIRKMGRRHGVPTRTLKANRLEKNGNPYRSVSMLGWGAGVFSSAGFLIIDPNFKDVARVSDIDCDTDRGKKKFAYKMTPSDAQSEITKLVLKQKMGGVSREFVDCIAYHSEILYHVTEVRAVYYTPDITLFTPVPHAEYHRNASLLQALFIQQEYENTHGKKLPLFEYSGINNSVKRMPDYLPEQIVKLWVEMCGDYLQRELPRAHLSPPRFAALQSLESLKTVAMYLTPYNSYAQGNAPADTNYDRALKAQIDAALEVEKNNYFAQLEQSILNKVRHEKISTTTPEVYFYLKNMPSLGKQLKENILHEIAVEMKSDCLYASLSEACLKLSVEDEKSPKFIKLFALLQTVENKELEPIKKHLIFMALTKLAPLQQSEERLGLQPDCLHDCYDADVETKGQKIKNLIAFARHFAIEAELKTKLQNVVNRFHSAMLKDFYASMSNIKLVTYVMRMDELRAQGFVPETYELSSRRAIVDYADFLAKRAKPSALNMAIFIKLVKSQNIT